MFYFRLTTHLLNQSVICSVMSPYPVRCLNRECFCYTNIHYIPRTGLLCWFHYKLKYLWADVSSLLWKKYSHFLKNIGSWIQVSINSGEPNWNVVSDGIFCSISVIFKWAALCRCTLHLFSPSEEDKLIKKKHFAAHNLAAGFRSVTRLGSDVLHYSSGLVLRPDPFGWILLRPEPSNILSLCVYGPREAKMP